MSVSREEFRKLKPVTIEDDERLIKEENKENAKRQHAQYYKKNKDKIKKYIRQWTNEHIEERKEYMHNWYEINKEMLNACSRQYNKEHKDEVVEYNKQYRENNAEEIKKYRQTETFKKIRRKVDAKMHARRKGLGFIPLNEPFPDSHGHHFNKEGVIYIPEELHCSIGHNVWTGRNMQKINRLAFDWLENVELPMPMESWMRC